MAKILIAEDDATVRSLIRMTLDSGQTEILEVEDGTEALVVARRELPELIFLDWSMPGSSGIEVCRALRADAATADIKVVMLTARSDDHDRDAGFAAGADEYITKPFSPADDHDRDAGFAAGADEYITKPFSPVHLLDKVLEVLGPGALIAPR